MIALCRCRPHKEECWCPILYAPNAGSRKGYSEESTSHHSEVHTIDNSLTCFTGFLKVDYSILISEWHWRPYYSTWGRILYYTYFFFCSDFYKVCYKIPPFKLKLCYKVDMAVSLHSSLKYIHHSIQTPKLHLSQLKMRSLKCVGLIV